MAENKSSPVLKAALISFAAIGLIYGLWYFISPESMVKLSGSEPIDTNWLRWSGGTLTALGIGALMVLLKPKGQGIFITISALGNLFAGLALLYAWITSGEESNQRH
jgi:hypothetical protein